MNTKMTRFLAVAFTLSLVVVASAQEPTPPAVSTDVPAQERSPQEQPPQGQRGRFKIVREKVWIPGRIERVWIDAVYTTGYDGQGRPVQVLVSPGQYKDVRVPGRHEVRTRRVWVPEPQPQPVSTFTLRNTRTFQVQLQSVHVALSDGSTALVDLPKDRVISSTKELSLDLPPGAVSVTIRFKTWDWGNRRFRFPIYSAHYPLDRGSRGLIH